MANLKLNKVNKIYPNGVQAVFDFDVDIKDKEFIVFVGPSGCGKSTTLRMIAGLETITSGEFYINGELMNSIEPKDRNIAMVFQNYALYPHLTVYGNLKFALKLRKVPRPIYTNLDDPEVAAIIEENKKLFEEANKYNKQFKKKQYDDALLLERREVYKKLFENEEKLQGLLVQAVGIDNYSIEQLTKTIAKRKKAIAKNEAIIVKYKDEYPQETQRFINTNLNNQKQIEEFEQRLEYLKNNEVPLNEVRHLTKYEMDIEINKAAESIDLERYLYRKPAALSGGQRQRVALGRAIVRKPAVFLMDEPLSNLDAKLRVQTRSEIIKIHQKVGATTVYVTHDQTEAMTMADRIVVMKDGYVQQIGSPKELFKDPANKFVVVFEIADGSFTSDGLVTVAGGGRFHFKSSLRGVKSVEVTGSGQFFIFSGLEGWSWDDKNVVSGVLSSTTMHYAFDEHKVNNIQFYSNSGFTITSLKINVAAETATGIEYDGDFTDHLSPWAGSRWDGLYGLNAGMQSTVTNGSKSALRIALPTVTEGDPWTPVCLSLGGAMNLSRSKGFSFDYKLVSGNAWSSFKLFNENTGSYVACDWYQSERLLGHNPANEVGINPDTNWKTQFVRPITDCVATHIIFTLHQVRTAANEEWNEIVIDNFKVTDRPYAQYETNLPEWSWRKVSDSMAITETMYAGKSVVIDFKPEGNGTFELTYMSDENHYVGTPNTITVNGESVTSTFGTITKGADGWYTLAVADAQLNDGQRTSYSSTVACIYLYRDVAPTCNFYVDYASLRAI